MVAGLAVLCWPREAWAWGPLAHLHFASLALVDLSSLSRATQALLSSYAGNFLYGSLAADIVVAKNLARYEVHCHNWAVGFDVLGRAREDADRAFSLGFLAHLAADTIAHNYFVPYKTVEGFQNRSGGHAAWELRYDQALSPDLWRVARDMTAFRGHDEHLRECLARSTPLPFSLSRRLFGGLLLTARFRRWQTLSRLFSGPRRRPLAPEEFRECEALAVEQILGLLRDGPSAACTRADPTGLRNLHLARRLCHELRSKTHLEPDELSSWLREARRSFRDSLFGPLALPEFNSRAA